MEADDSLNYNLEADANMVFFHKVLSNVKDSDSDNGNLTEAQEDEEEITGNKSKSQIGSRKSNKAKKKLI